MNKPEENLMLDEMDYYYKMNAMTQEEKDKADAIYEARKTKKA